MFGAAKPTALCGSEFWQRDHILGKAEADLRSGSTDPKPKFGTGSFGAARTAASSRHNLPKAPLFGRDLVRCYFAAVPVLQPPTPQISKRQSAVWAKQIFDLTPSHSLGGTKGIFLVGRRRSRANVGRVGPAIIQDCSTPLPAKSLTTYNEGVPAACC